MGSTFFRHINSELWGDILISMLTLFRVMTFEGWTEVMYETMQVYRLSWVYYLSFIFFTAFAFLNMIIGVVVNVLEEEREKNKADKAKEEGSATLESLSKQLIEIQKQLSELKK